MAPPLMDATVQGPAVVMNGTASNCAMPSADVLREGMTLSHVVGFFLGLMTDSGSPS